MDSETGLIFHASTSKSQMEPYMTLKSTSAIVIQNIFPRKATLLFRQNSHYIRYNSCVWRRWWRWFRRCPFGSSDHALSHFSLEMASAHPFGGLRLEENIYEFISLIQFFVGVITNEWSEICTQLGFLLIKVSCVSPPYSAQNFMTFCP